VRLATAARHGAHAVGGGAVGQAAVLRIGGGWAAAAGIVALVLPCVPSSLAWKERRGRRQTPAPAQRLCVDTCGRHGPPTALRRRPRRCGGWCAASGGLGRRRRCALHGSRARWRHCGVGARGLSRPRWPAATGPRRGCVAGVLARFIEDPEPAHWQAARAVLRYLVGATGIGLCNDRS